MKNRKAIIVGISSHKLKKNEIIFLKKKKPWGVILFTRNIKNIKQVKKLVLSIKSCFKDINYPIMIDEEGGTVSRLGNILDTKIFSSRYFCQLYLKDKKKFFLHYQIYINSVSSILNEIGININTVPVLDVIRKKTHKIIGSRAFSNDPKIVSIMGKYCVKFFKKNKIANVIKHIPGHGLALFDSHLLTPVVNEKKNILTKIDFTPFKNQNTFFAMTSHIVYKALDPKNVATHSKHIVQDIIRKNISFKNIIITDDISMKALKHSFSDNIKKSYEAGCNLVLHCNGNLSEMYMLASIAPNIDNFIIKKTSQFYKFLL